MNVDGALFEDLQVMGVGVVLRDNKGCVIMAASICEQVDLVSDNNENLAYCVDCNHGDLELHYCIGLPNVGDRSNATRRLSGTH